MKCRKWASGWEFFLNNLFTINIILINVSTVIANSLYAMLTKVNLNDGLQDQGIPTPVVLSITHLFELSSKFHLAELFTHTKKKCGQKNY